MVTGEEFAPSARQQPQLEPLWAFGGNRSGPARLKVPRWGRTASPTTCNDRLSARDGLIRKTASSVVEGFNGPIDMGSVEM